MRKTWVIFKLKVKMLMTNTSALTGPLMAVGITVLMRILYSSLTDNPETLEMMFGLALSMGVSFNIGMGALMMTALPLAEEKEKNTLRSLMTSSVTARDFFVGSILPPFIITVTINYLLLFISGANVANFDMGQYTVLTLLSALISCLLGLLIGISSKSQVHANNIMMPITLVLAMTPSFSMFNESLGKVADYIYTGMFDKMLKAFNSGTHFSFNIPQVSILLMCVVITSALFVYYYNKNGVELD